MSEQNENKIKILSDMSLKDAISRCGELQLSNDSIARNNDLTAANKARIEELRQATQDSTKSLEERKKASNELLQLERDNYKMTVSNVTGAYKVFEGKNKNLIDAMKRGSAKQFAEVEKYMNTLSISSALAEDYFITILE